MEASSHNVAVFRPSDYLRNFLLIFIICFFEFFLGPIFALAGLLGVIREEYLKPAVSALAQGQASVPKKWLRNRYNVLEPVSQV